jgi:uncharacterized protein YndB with AHSA1/START domain
MKSEVEITPNRLQMTRVFAAPRPLVFSFWTSSEKMQQWSSCKQALRCEVAMDFRVGGSFTHTMEISGAGVFTVVGTYEQIVAPERIVYLADFKFAVTRVTWQFIDMGASTKVILSHESTDGNPIPDIFATNAQIGTEESFEFLDALLAS